MLNKNALGKVLITVATRFTKISILGTTASFHSKIDQELQFFGYMLRFQREQIELAMLFCH